MTFLVTHQSSAGTKKSITFCQEGFWFSSSAPPDRGLSLVVYDFEKETCWPELLRKLPMSVLFAVKRDETGF